MSARVSRSTRPVRFTARPLEQPPEPHAGRITGGRASLSTIDSAPSRASTKPGADQPEVGGQAPCAQSFQAPCSAAMLPVKAVWVTRLKPAVAIIAENAPGVGNLRIDSTR